MIWCNLVPLAWPSQQHMSAGPNCRGVSGPGLQYAPVYDSQQWRTTCFALWSRSSARNLFCPRKTFLQWVSTKASFREPLVKLSSAITRFIHTLIHSSHPCVYSYFSCILCKLCKIFNLNIKYKTETLKHVGKLWTTSHLIYSNEYSSSTLFLRTNIWWFILLMLSTRGKKQIQCNVYVYTVQ